MPSGAPTEIMSDTSQVMKARNIDIAGGSLAADSSSAADSSAVTNSGSGADSSAVVDSGSGADASEGAGDNVDSGEIRDVGGSPLRSRSGLHEPVEYPEHAEGGGEWRCSHASIRLN
jgi:hypothetical protein